MVTRQPDDIQQFQQFGDGRDLVALPIDDDLPQADVVGGGPGADHVDGGLGIGLVEALAEGLAIDGDELPGGDLVQRGDPTEVAVHGPGHLPG